MAEEQRGIFMREHTGEVRKVYWVLSEHRNASQRLGMQAGCAGRKAAFEMAPFA